MTTEKTTPKRIGAALLTLALTGCAQVIGIDEFTLGGEGGGSGSGGQTVDPCNEVHGCKREAADNLTALPTVNISFDPSGYEPPCVRAKAGATVKFDGQAYNFENVSIAGGVSPTVDPDSPIKNPIPADVSAASFVLGSECSYPYFSPSLGNAGVIFIQ